MKKTTIILVGVLLCLNFCAKAQSSNAKQNSNTTTNNSLSSGEGRGGALKVGDKVPASFWTQQHNFYQNGEANKQTLAAFKGKLLVLDFWASWCGSCINKFRSIEKLQTEFKEDAAFLLVNTKDTRDSLMQVDDLLSGRKYKGEPYQLASLFQDTYIHQLFPHGYMPYYVIVSASGEVRAIVPAELVTAANINLMIVAYGKKTKKGNNHGQ